MRVFKGMIIFILMILFTVIYFNVSAIHCAEIAPTLLGSFMVLLAYLAYIFYGFPKFKPTPIQVTLIRGLIAMMIVYFAAVYIFGAFAGDLLIEITNLPDLIKDEIKDLANNTWGILAIAILGPISEELLFREGVCGYLARNGIEPRKAIWISAVLFGLIHVNPAQVVIAILIGLMLGVIYIKTGNIVITSIIHILNNSIAVIQAQMLGDKADDFSMVEWIGGNWVAGICIIVGFTLCFYLLRKMWEEYPNNEEYAIDNDTDCQPITTNDEQN